jgi:uncharacterized membrane protein (DUF441 family)
MLVRHAPLAGYSLDGLENLRIRQLVSGCRFRDVKAWLGAACLVVVAAAAATGLSIWGKELGLAPVLIGGTTLVLAFLLAVALRE